MAIIHNIFRFLMNVFMDLFQYVYCTIELDLPKKKTARPTSTLTHAPIYKFTYENS